MSSRGKTRSGHYQVEGGIGMGPERSPPEVQKRKDHDAPPLNTTLTPGRRGLGTVVHGGELLGRTAVAVCTECEVEIGVQGNVPVRPCANCGGTSFRVVS